VAQAILRFGVQGGVSVGGGADCQGWSRPVFGEFEPEDALRRLLPDGCGYRKFDAQTFRIDGDARRPAAPAVAPAAIAPSPAELDELIVTAERREEALRGSPNAVTVLPRADLQRLNVRSVADLVAVIPGLTETNLGAGRNKIFVRGISDGVFTGRTQSTVGLYFDEVPITLNAPDPDLRLVDVARVEVLRGPQGTLYGSGSIGGIVRIMPQKPDLDAAAAELAAEGAVNAQKDVANDVEGYVNAPLAPGRLAVRAVAYRDELAGYLDNPRLGVDDVNHAQRIGGRLSALFEVTPVWRAEATLVRQSIQAADSQYVQGSGGLSRDTSIREPYHNNFTLVGANNTVELPTATFNFAAAYVDHDYSNRYDAEGAFDLAPGRLAAFDEANNVELWTTEAVARSKGNGPARWLAGAFASYSRDRSTGTLDATLSGGARRTVYVRRDVTDEFALFGETDRPLTPHLVLTVGGRAFITTVRTQAGQFELATTPIADLDEKLRYRGLAAKVRLRYVFAPDRVVYMQTQDGYRAGGFNLPAGIDGSSGGIESPRYRPDRLRSYELGASATFFHRTLDLRAAVFRASWREVQTDQFRPSGLPVTLNVGDGANTGFELETFWRPGVHWQFHVDGLLNGPELVRSLTVAPVRGDIGLPGVAKATGAADVAYQWSPAPGLEAELSAQVSYVGRSFISFDGAASSAMGDYAQGRVSASLAGRAWRAAFYVDNLTDERANTFAFGNPFSQARARQVTPLAPRSFRLRLSRDF
jgi:outer membrane receptor protein involved in Fe transport